MRQGITMALILALGIVGGSAIDHAGEADALPQQAQSPKALKQIVRKLDAVALKLNGVALKVTHTDEAIGDDEGLLAGGSIRFRLNQMALQQEAIWKMALVICNKVDDPPFCSQISRTG